MRQHSVSAVVVCESWAEPPIVLVLCWFLSFSPQSSKGPIDGAAISMYQNWVIMSKKSGSWSCKQSFSGNMHFYRHKGWKDVNFHKIILWVKVSQTRVKTGNSSGQKMHPLRRAFWSILMIPDCLHFCKITGYFTYLEKRDKKLMPVLSTWLAKEFYAAKGSQHVVCKRISIIRVVRNHQIIYKNVTFWNVPSKPAEY